MLDCWSSFSGTVISGSRGFMVQGGPYEPNTMTWIGGRARMSSGAGIEINGAIWIKIIGMEIGGNGQGTPAAGIATSAVKNILIEGNQISTSSSGGGTGQQQWGILMRGDEDEVLIVGNDLAGNTVAPFGLITEFPSSANVVINGNLGLDGNFRQLAASATLDISSAPNLFKIVGGTLIVTMMGGWAGRQVQLIFLNGGGFTSGGNIARAVTAAVNQLVNCTFDGTTWYCE